MATDKPDSSPKPQDQLQDRFPSQAEGDLETVEKDLQDQEKKSQKPQ